MSSRNFLASTFIHCKALNILQGTATTTPNTTPASTSTSATSTGTAGSGNSGLNTAAKAAGKLYYGTASDLPSNTAYIADLSNAADFGQLTPANQMKWVRYTVSLY